ncbi:MAG TPA: BatA domain-containing protein [Gemmatimonadaceae bacterium]|nr:BatA domain-containing protein [Gemmatimonadaceae bacterium]
MTFLSPGFLYAALAAAAAVVALHFIVTRQPRAGVLPTARFVPDLPATATARAARPSDLLLMILRILLVLAAGAALAGPILTPSRKADARVILADVSAASLEATGLRDSIHSIYRDGDALVVFDSSARVTGIRALDSLTAGVSQVPRSDPSAGNISTALISAIRAAGSLRERADSIELVIVSPFVADEIDAATDSIRALWPGKARLVRLPIAGDTSPRAATPLTLQTAAGDPLQITAGLGRRQLPSGANIIREPSSGLRPQIPPVSGGAVVEWPITGRPRGALRRQSNDTIGGVIAGRALVIAAFERRWIFPADSIRDANVIARWVDGEPAAVEWRANGGCIRSVAVPVAAIGDLVIRDDFVRFVAALSRDCSARTRLAMSASALGSLRRAGGKAPRDAFRPRSDVQSTLAPWLFALAIAAALTELLVRRRSEPRASPELPRAPVAST